MRHVFCTSSLEVNVQRLFEEKYMAQQISQTALHYILSTGESLLCDTEQKKIGAWCLVWLNQLLKHTKPTSMSYKSIASLPQWPICETATMYLFILYPQVAYYWQQ